jgi:hypothetical protein
MYICTVISVKNCELSILEGTMNLWTVTLLTMFLMAVTFLTISLFEGENEEVEETDREATASSLRL